MKVASEFERLGLLIDDFVSGRERSKRSAGEIAVLLDVFDDEEPYATAAHMLASYDPSGDDLTYDDAAIANQLEAVRRALADR